jgi:membrane-bound lytic murein transglycosylase D
MKYCFAFFAALMLGLMPARANHPPDDTLKILQDVNIEDFTRNLDSLLQTWYVKNTLRLNHQDEEFFIASDSFKAPVFSDTVMIQRLRSINSYIDLSYNEIVQKFIDLYSIRRKRLVEIMMGLSEYYFPIFEAALDANGCPLELKYLPVIESALNTHAVSRAGATGLWQFMYTTGRQYRLRVNTYIDERRDPYASSQAAAKYLKDLYNIYNDWTLAIAAYNCGPGNVNKAIKRSGKTSYWEIYNYLPRETRGYVPAFVAAIYVMHYHKDYNISPYRITYPVKTDTIMLSQQVHFGQISAVLGIPAAELKDLNPQYRKDIVPAYNDTFPLRLPSEYTLRFISLQDSIFNYADSLYNKSFYAEVPDPKSRSISRPYVSNSYQSGNAVTYTVKSGDNLGAIAQRHGVTVSQLKDWNGLHSNNIRVGQKISIYPKGKVQSENKTEKVVTNAETSKQSGNMVYYTVKSGDNFWSIAQKYPGVTNTEIMEWNNIKDARSLKPGQKLKIYKK